MRRLISLFAIWLLTSFGRLSVTDRIYLYQLKSVLCLS